MVPIVGQVDRNSNGGLSALEQRDEHNQRHVNPVNDTTEDYFGVRRNFLPPGVLERPAGIGPASLAWEAKVLPLYDGRVELMMPDLLDYLAS